MRLPASADHSSAWRLVADAPLDEVGAERNDSVSTPPDLDQRLRAATGRKSTEDPHRAPDGQRIPLGAPFTQCSLAGPIGRLCALVQSRETGANCERALSARSGQRLRAREARARTHGLRRRGPRFRGGRAPTSARRSAFYRFWQPSCPARLRRWRTWSPPWGLLAA